MSWQRQPRRVSVLAEMALRQEKVSARLTELRERHGLSQEDAARKVGITVRQWQRWETGESMPYPRNLDAVASSFGVTVSGFFDEASPVIENSQLDRIEGKLDELLGMLRDPASGVAEDIATHLAEQQAAASRAAGGSNGRSDAKKATPPKAPAPKTRRSA
jgi:transcriptional regulator with XRE-family HTH domain